MGGPRCSRLPNGAPPDQVFDTKYEHEGNTGLAEDLMSLHKDQNETLPAPQGKRTVMCKNYHFFSHQVRLQRAR